MWRIDNALLLRDPDIVLRGRFVAHKIANMGLRKDLISYSLCFVSFRGTKRVGPTAGPFQVGEVWRPDFDRFEYIRTVVL